MVKNRIARILPREIVEMFEYEIEEGRYRKCSSSDFVEIVSAMALSVDDLYDFKIRKFDDNWYLIHTWTINGDDFAIAMKFDKEDIVECIVIDSTMPTPSRQAGRVDKN